MYLRFTVPGTVTRARVAPGLFAAAGRFCWQDVRDDPVIVAIRREVDWFNDRLPIPRRFGVVAKGREWRDGICWFRDQAREVVGHAHTLAALLGECGVPVERIWTRDPGQVLYRDPFQVVAKPERGMLRNPEGPTPNPSRAREGDELETPLRLREGATPNLPSRLREGQGVGADFDRRFP